MKGIVQFFSGPNVSELDNKTIYSEVDSTLIWHDRGQYGMASAYAILIFFVLVTVLFAVVLKELPQLRGVINHIPESGIVLTVGLLVSCLWWLGTLAFQKYTDYNIKSEYLIPLFWIQHIFIPPIILHASFELYNPQFFEQIGSVLTMAIVGTLLNTVLIALGVMFVLQVLAPLLYPGMTIFQIFTFASIISAVDPVAVLAIFEAVGADRALYFLVFGEALLNDGVTFVLFEGVKELGEVSEEDLASVSLDSYLWVLLSFLTAPLGGILVGFVAGLLAALITKYASEALEYHKPMLILIFFCLAYTATLVLKVSGILAIISFGLTTTRYTVTNMSAKASCLTSSITKTIATVLETLLFFLLGTQFNPSNFLDIWQFCIAVIVIITVGRLLVTCGLCLILNTLRKEKINWRWQTIIVLGGLRGAIAFSMVASYGGPYRQLFQDTVIITILFTTVVQGIVTKPLVTFLDLKMNRERNPKIRDMQKFVEFKEAVSQAGSHPSSASTEASVTYTCETHPGCLCRCWTKLEAGVLAPVFTREGNIRTAVMKELYEYEEHKIYTRQAEEVKNRNAASQPNTVEVQGGRSLR